MSTQFLPKLSQNFIELLKDDEYYDTTIEVGADPNVKIFRTHMNILCYRSPYLRRALASNKKNNNELAHIKLPTMSPEIFQIILKYIYGGILSLNQDNLEILKVLTAADELLLQELVDHLQRYLIENKSEWIEQNFELTHRTSFQSNNLLELQQFCTNLMAKFPERIFISFDFTLLPEKSLISFIKRNDLRMKEIEVWEHVLKWGHAQNPTLISDPDTWSDDDFKIIANTLQHCLSLIRFFSLSSKELVQRVKPYRKLLNNQLYEDLTNSYMDPDSVSTDNILPPRYTGVIDSQIVDLGIVSTVSRWIDKIVVTNDKFTHFRDVNLPYKFELLLRGSQDGFTPKIFHTLCDGKDNTVTFLKVKGTEEILGGYNPLEWKSSLSCGKTKDSFIFSFKNKNNFFKDAIISNVENADGAIYYSNMNGPCFAGDILINAYAVQPYDEYNDFNTIRCKKCSYEKKIRDTEDQFIIEDYEVFQITKRFYCI